MTPADFAFWLLAGIAVAAALGAVLRRDLVIAALNLVLMMLALAGIFLLLAAPFVAALQVIVYSGAIMVLFIFAIMLLNAPEERAVRAISPVRLLLAAAGSLLFFAAIAAAAARSPGLGAPLAGPWDGSGEPGAVSGELLGRMALPFEIVSVLLTAAMLGAVALAKRKLAGYPEAAPGESPS